jgi:uncharacterized protein YndB with AHSA1/START domain
MTRVTVSRTIKAPVEAVFHVITDIEGLPDSNPDVAKVEFLSDTRSGAGTRFLETRVAKGKEVVTELEVTEQVNNKYARFVSDMHGTVWDTLFTVRPAGSPVGAETVLEIQLDARTYKLLPKLINPLMKGMIRKGMETHIDSMRALCEQG